MKTFDKLEELGPWFHNIHLPDGTQTAPHHFLGDFPAFKWDKLKAHVPQDLSGWKVLDIGCNAGFYSIELAKRGAQVLAIDLDLHYLKQAKWVAAQFGIEDLITFRQLQVYDLAKLEEKFDLVWFMGVFYHLRYPLLALDIISERCRNLLLFQTLTMPGEDLTEQIYDLPINQREQFQHPSWPKMAFIEQKFAGDPTNWWLANESLMVAMLRSAGFEVLTKPMEETFLAEKSDKNTSVAQTWNKSEYLSAIQQDWTDTFLAKTKNK